MEDGNINNPFLEAKMPPEMRHFMSHYRDEFWSNKPPGLLEVTYYLLDAMLQPSRLY